MGRFWAASAVIFHRAFSSRSTGLPIFFAALVVAAGAAEAQQPTDAQRNAVRSACRSDFIAQCSGVTPGGMEALNCLQQHSSSLSKACRAAISGLEGQKKTSNDPASGQAPASQPPAAATAPAAAQPTAAQRDAVKSACRSDFMAQCPGVAPGGAQALSCLQQHGAALSPACQSAIGALGGAGTSGGGSVAKGAGNSSAPAAAPMASFTPREELIVVRRTCGPDFRALCHAVPLGGGRGVNCLRDNYQRLSPTCQKVLSSGL
ncbi:cysteine rich repeat-containing protein [Rhizobium sp. S152]|uniref:cysteine rich repeat-containing protein n=1 Tax=Rhizobium sp. S152 TaxID=3055038 RepID=UPI0025A940D0|nr:cysteine rich repeat-containing protein [Rhizobium sp. S152]MDM9625395.1 cysteine rich repeat-containing protein [Rhizobium sp. S152]